MDDDLESLGSRRGSDSPGVPPTLDVGVAWSVTTASLSAIELASPDREATDRRS
jgi:hypothetical protein